MTDLRCPICGATFDASESPAMPFCSVRCQYVDLNRWLSEDYGIPCTPDEENRDEQHLEN